MVADIKSESPAGFRRNLQGGDYWRFAMTMELDDAERFAIFLYGVVQKRRAKDAEKAALAVKESAKIAEKYLAPKPE